MVPKSVATAALVASGPRRLRLVHDAGRAEGDVEGYYLSPVRSREWRDHLEAVVREIVRAYPVDGLHFDFIRYPGPDFDYSRAALEGFRRQSGRADLLGGPARDPGSGTRTGGRCSPRSPRGWPTRLAWSGPASPCRRRWPRTRPRPSTTSSRTGRGGWRAAS